MIAYDLDGVFIPELVWKDSIADHLLYFRHNHMTPIFQPEGDFILITGRPYIDKQETIKWIDEHWTNKPLLIFHDNTDYRYGVDYKIKVLRENPQIRTFVESELIQVYKIESALKSWGMNTKIIHFPTLISSYLNSIKDVPYEILP